MKVSTNGEIRLRRSSEPASVVDAPLAGSSFETVTVNNADVSRPSRGGASAASSSPWKPEFEVFAEWVPQIVIVSEPDGSCDHFNSVGEAFAGRATWNGPGRGWVALVHPDDAEAAASEWATARRTGEPLEAEHRIRRADGVYRWMAVRALPVRDVHATIVNWVGTWTDVTTEVEAEALRSAVMSTMAEGLYVLDAEGKLLFMNGAATRMLGWEASELQGRSMHDAVHSQRADGSQVQESDCELSKIRTRGQVVRSHDDAFIRKDGSILPVAYSASPLLIGSRLRGGVVIFRDITDEKARLTQVQRELDTLAWVGRIKEALDEGRFALYSQPIVALNGGSDYEELLLRMIGHHGEVILPGAFLAVAETYGLVGEIDRWVIAAAIEIAASGRRVSINVSAHSVEKLDLIPLISHQLGRTGADPANLVFEITETALMNDMDSAEVFAACLVDMGCVLALDDFGAGFGSFTYLQKLPLHSLKIDVQFVTGLVSNPANQHIVNAIIGLAQRFDLEVTAEGVETLEVLTLLRSYGVDYAQGNLLGYPTPVGPLNAK